MSNVYSSDPEGLEHKGPSFCSRLLKYSWKTISCLFSHITLVSMVVSYCILGALTFEKLEKENEIKVKKNISSIRNYAIDKLWNITYNGSRVLREEHFIQNSTEILKNFEHDLLTAITRHGWDGDENVEKVQWNLPGALFYSIIVITTIALISIYCGFLDLAYKLPMLS
ncbi:hypothetical protein AMK59_2047 [Oryctes borbonicus]|uniref:Uncharacterized protein n=1 Tax=Oryctes borbonicus TaxID=1629725 RepID=A0A0T6BG50_9SCAR|nr:hypothetical protein AMK59_2047 [Oryctes borbonicus]